MDSSQTPLELCSPNTFLRFPGEQILENIFHKHPDSTHNPKTNHK